MGSWHLGSCSDFEKQLSWIEWFEEHRGGEAAQHFLRSQMAPFAFDFLTFASHSKYTPPLTPEESYIHLLIWGTLEMHCNLPLVCLLGLA